MRFFVMSSLLTIPPYTIQTRITVCHTWKRQSPRYFSTVSLVQWQILSKHLSTTKTDTVRFSNSVVPDHPPRDLHLWKNEYPHWLFPETPQHSFYTMAGTSSNRVVPQLSQPSLFCFLCLPLASPVTFPYFGYFALPYLCYYLGIYRLLFPGSCFGSYWLPYPCSWFCFYWPLYFSLLLWYFYQFWLPYCQP